MTIKQAQETVDNWIKEVGVRYFSELTNTAMLMEEVGEVARIMARSYGDQSFKKSDETVNLADEMADVLFVLICLANQTGIDLTEALQANLNKKTIRDKDRHQNKPKVEVVVQNRTILFISLLNQLAYHPCNITQNTCY